MRKPLVVIAMCGTVLGLPGSGRANRVPGTTHPATLPAPFQPLGLGKGPATPQSRDHRDRRDSLRETVDAARPGLEKAAAHLAAANWMLAVPASDAATAWLLGVAGDSDLQGLSDWAKSAKEHLAKAKEAIASAGHDTAQDESGGKRRSRLERLVTLLEPFATLFASADPSLAADARRSGYGRAALGLATAREAEDRSLASCALLWQSFAWEQAGRRERALVSLPDALTKPEHPPYDFMSRLLRCRLVADAGQRPAAAALLIRMGAISKEWFPRTAPDELESRRRLIILLQYQVCLAWRQELLKTGPSVPGPLDELLAEARETLSAADRPAAYRLDAVIPILVEPPAVTRKPTSTRTAPAATVPP